jgi:acetyl-CoA carboxylase alpha subunit
LQNALIACLRELMALDTNELLSRRRDRFNAFGQYKEG